MALPIKYKLKAENKNAVRKGYNRRIREIGKISGIIYGEDKTKNTMIKLNRVEFEKIFNQARERSIIELDIEGIKKPVLIRDYQIDPIKRYFTHVDFYEVREGHPIKTKVPLTFTGVPVGLKMGGVLEQYKQEIAVKCIPKLIPESLVLDVTELDIKDGLKISDLDVPESVKFLHKDNEYVVRVVPSRKSKMEEDEEAEAAATAATEAAEAAEAEAAEEKEKPEKSKKSK